jgi:hypothetical protein
VETRWVNLEEYARSNVNIEEEEDYTVGQLFQYLLRTREVMTNTLVVEAASIDEKTPSAEVLRILTDISTNLGKASAMELDEIDEAMRPLFHKAIFPVRGSAACGSHVRLATLLDTTWYICDRLHLLESFSGRVSMLAFPVECIGPLGPLLKFFKLDHRRLSKVVTIKTGLGHGAALAASPSNTLRFRARVPFINAYVISSPT